MKKRRSLIGFTAVLLLALGGSSDACGPARQPAIYLIHFSVRPRSDGTLDLSAISAASSQEVVQAAHAAGRKVLLCAGGSDTGAAWAPAIAGPATRSALVDALLAMVTDRHYDGIELDFEPLDPARLGDPSLLADFGAFVDELHARLAPQGLLLTPLPARRAWRPASMPRAKRNSIRSTCRPTTCPASAPRRPGTTPRSPRAARSTGPMASRCRAAKASCSSSATPGPRRRNSDWGSISTGRPGPARPVRSRSSRASRRRSPSRMRR
jgi:hypothetical protein